MTPIPQDRPGVKQQESGAKPTILIGTGIPFPDQTKLEISTYLEQVIETLFQAFNARDRSAVNQLLPRIFAHKCSNEAEDPSFVATPGGKAQIGEGMANLEKNPTLRIDTYEPMATVDVQNGKARVITGTKISGNIEENFQIMREAFVGFDFRRTANNEWLCYKVDKIRGPGHYLYGIGSSQEE